MKKRLSFFFLILLFYHDLHSQSAYIGAYYENYSQYQTASGNRASFSIEKIPGQWLDELYVAFGTFGYRSQTLNPQHYGLTGDFLLQPTEVNDLTYLYPAINKLKIQFPQLKTMLAIGGWNFNNPLDPVGAKTYRLFSQMIGNPQNRKEFIDSAVVYLHRHGFNGLDIDWEYPGDLERGGNKDDFANFILFLQECQQQFKTTHPTLKLSFTAPAFVPKGLPKEYREQPERFYQWLAKCIHFLDQLNVMCYDYHGPFNQPKITGANAPLSRDTDPSSLLFVEHSLKVLIENKIPAEKIVLGLPTFGHSFAGVDFSKDHLGPGLPFTNPGSPGLSTKQEGFLAYFEIADKISSKEFLFGTDPITQTAYAYQKSIKEWISFDTPETIALKVLLAKKMGIKGVYFWSINMDEYQWPPRFPNLKSTYETLNP